MLWPVVNLLSLDSGSAVALCCRQSPVVHSFISLLPFTACQSVDMLQLLHAQGSMSECFGHMVIVKYNRVACLDRSKR